MSASLVWKFNRLRAMSAREIAWRLWEILRAKTEAHGFGTATQVPQAAGVTGRPWITPLAHGFDAEPYVAAADRRLEGRWDVFALRDVELGFPPRWNRDAKTGTEAPLVFGKGLDYRDERLVGDIKYLWEPNRHSDVVTLAQAWHLTGEWRYADGCRILLDSWFDGCPYPLGPNWTSSLELAVRLANWAVAWHLLGGETAGLFQGLRGQAFRTRWQECVYRHCHFIAGHLSRHSSANNHLLGELMGLFIAAVTWPLWPSAKRWRDRAWRELEEQALLQTGPDGVNREQAFYYHHEVADMMLLAWRFGETNGVGFSEHFRGCLIAMLEFVASVMDVGGHTPMVGDADDALMVRFSREPDFCPYRSLLATGASLFGRGDFKAKAGRFDDKSRWLLGGGGQARFEALAATPDSLPPRRAFPSGGYYVLGYAFETPQEVRMVADAGPLGYLAIAAHGHADALSFTLSVGGQEILIDPGTYAYHTERDWRDYFRGTSAHNTMRVDGENQSVSGGNFLWLKKAKAACELWETGQEVDRFIGSHDGYRRLPDPVVHRREITLFKMKCAVRITDELQCRARHVVERFWHFSERARVMVDGPVIAVECGAAQVHFRTCAENTTAEVLCGSVAPLGGWVSRSYDVKCPTTTVLWRSEIEGSARLVTDMAFGI